MKPVNSVQLNSTHQKQAMDACCLLLLKFVLMFSLLLLSIHICFHLFYSWYCTLGIVLSVRSSIQSILLFLNLILLEWPLQFSLTMVCFLPFLSKSVSHLCTLTLMSNRFTQWLWLFRLSVGRSGLLLSSIDFHWNRL